VADAAAVLSAIVGVDPRDPATAASEGHLHTDYTRFIDPNGLRGARIGVMRAGVTGYSEETDRVFEQALAVMRDAGAVLVDPADLPTIEEINSGAAEITVLVYEFKRDLESYLRTRPDVPQTLGALIQFNLANADRELKWFLQEWFDFAEANPFTDQQYADALARARAIGGPLGIDKVLTDNNLVALVAPTGAPAWPTDLVNGDHFLGASSGPAAIAGYPIVQVPAGNAFGLPVGISFIGTAWSEDKLIGVASGFENAARARRKPEFLATLPTDGARRRARRNLTAPSANRPLIGNI
jgi:amidase